MTRRRSSTAPARNPARWTTCRLSLHRFHAAHDFAEFGGDLGLAGAVVLHGEGLDHLVGVVGCALHGNHAGDVFAGDGVEEGLVQGDADGDGEEVFDDGARTGGEVVDGLADEDAGRAVGGGDVDVG